jgi:hypothetical protein
VCAARRSGNTDDALKQGQVNDIINLSPPSLRVISTIIKLRRAILPLVYGGEKGEW